MGILKAGYFFPTLCGGCTGERGRSDCYALKGSVRGEEGRKTDLAYFSDSIICISLIVPYFSSWKLYFSDSG